MAKPASESLPETIPDQTKEAPIRVLHVDDEAEFLKTAKQILETQGSFQVETALSVEEAKEKMKQKTFDVIISDYVMPGKNGLDFLKELRDDGSNIPFIMFTGKGREEVAIKALNLGADRYFNKIGDPETVYGELAIGIRRTVKFKQAEEELRKSEDKYRSLAENAGTGVATTDLEGKFNFVNQALCKMTGYSEKELIGKPFADFLHPDDKERILQAFLDSWKHPDLKIHIEFKALHKNGHIVHMYSSPTATVCNNKIVGFNAIVSDITERKKTEQALRESEEKWKSLMENSPDHIMLLDKDAKILYINHTVPDLTIEEVLGKSVYDYVPSAFHKIAADCFERVLETGKQSSYVTEYHTKEGEIRHFDVRIAPVFHSGKVVGLIIHSTDITEQKRAEIAQRFQRDMAIALSTTVGLKETLSKLLEVTLQLEEVDSGGIYLVDSTTGALDLMVHTGLSDKFVKEVAHYDSDSTQAQVVKRGKSIYQKAGEFAPAIRRDLEAESLRILAVIPILYEGKVIGDLNVASHTHDAFSAVTRHSLESVGVQIGGVIARVTTEEQLKKSEEKYRKQFEEAMDAIFLADAETGMIVDCNRAATKLVGREKSELIGKHQRILHPPEKIEGEFTRTFKQHQKEKEGQVLETQVITKNGEIRDVTIKANIFELGDKKLLQGTFRDITEKKKTEEALRRSEEEAKCLLEFQNKVIDTAVVWIHLLDAEGNATLWNRAAELISGYSREEVIGNRKIWEWLYPDPEHRAEYLRKAKEIIEKGARPENYETILRCKDGTLKTISWYPNNIVDEKGTPIGSITVGIDVTEQKRMAQELAYERDILQTLMDNIPDTIYFKDATSRFMRINKAQARALGAKDTADAIGKTDFDFFGEEHAQNAYVDEQRIVKTGEPLISKVEKITTPDGRLWWVSATKVPIKDKDGRIIGTVGISRDVTEQKKIEEALRESEGKYRELINRMNDTAWVIDFDGKFIDVNDAAVKVLGYSREELLSMGPPDIDTSLTLEEIRGLIKRMPTDEIQVFETTHTTKDGKKIPVEISSSLVTYQGKHAILSIARDISERKKAEESLNKMMDQLAVTNEKLGVVGKLTRHDVRNKLSAVVNNIYLTKQTLPNNHEALKYLRDIESTFNQVEEIFEFARIYEQLGTEKLSYMDVSKTVDEVAMLFSDLHGAKIVNDCHGLTVLADSLLRQLFYNLIDNSLKYGEKISQIRIYYEKLEEQLKLVYEDDGVGIPETEKEKLFKEGYGKGTGYGLYLIKKMCEIYGWAIQETGKQDKGAQFTITIPKMNENGKTAYQLN
jgi:PAS domain S-box-containing protein